jgi:hypothetical protein
MDLFDSTGKVTFSRAVGEVREPWLARNIAACPGSRAQRLRPACRSSTGIYGWILGRRLTSG